MSLEMARIVLVYGGSYSDIGDESQLSTDLNNLRKHVPGTNFLVLSDNPDYTGKHHKVESDCSINNYMLIGYPKNANRIEKKLIRIIRYLRLAYFLKGMLFILNARRLTKNKRAVFLNEKETMLLMKLRESDLLFNVGGGYFTSLNRLELYSKCFMYLIYRTFRKPIIMSGMMIGPFNNWFDKWLARFALNRVNVITLRDKSSLPVLERIGITKPIIMATADDAILLPCASRREVATILSNEGVNLDRTLIGINVFSRGLAYDLNVPHTRMRKALSLLAKALDCLISKHNAEIVFIPTSYHAEADDRMAAVSLKKLMIHNDKLHVIKDEYDEQTIKGIIRQMDLVIGYRYHFIIFAATSLVPSIGIYVDSYYERKLNDIFNIIGLGEYVVDIQNADFQKIISMIERALHEKELIRKKLSPKVEELGKLSLTSVNFARRLLACQK